jgi:hypothetical protein
LFQGHGQDLVGVNKTLIKKSPTITIEVRTGDLFLFFFFKVTVKFLVQGQDQGDLVGVRKLHQISLSLSL